MTSKRKRGRPKGAGEDLSRHLQYIATAICNREERSERAAARAALALLGQIVTERHLTRVYAAQRRELEVAAMRATVTYLSRFRDGFEVLLRVPDGWQRVLEHLEQLARAHPELDSARRVLFPRVRYLHRLEPVEQVAILERCGLPGPDTPSE